MSTIIVDRPFCISTLFGNGDARNWFAAAAHPLRALLRHSLAGGLVISTKTKMARSREAQNSRCTLTFMNPNPALASLCNEELLSATRDILRRGCVVEAELLVYLAEIEERRLHLEMACSSMFAFCVTKLGFSEDATYNRLGVARAAREFPAMLDALRSGDV